MGELLFMKILILMASYDTMYYFRGIADKLLKEGHTVTVMPALPTKIKGGRYNVRQCNWHFFDFSMIDRYKPDRILIWNGHHSPFNAAVLALKDKYNLLHVELAWMSQKEYIYIDHNIGGSSSIAKGFVPVDKFTERHKKYLEMFKQKYKVVSSGEKLPEDFILVPLQLEADTSIVLDSPYFKTMDSLIGYVIHNSGNYNIVVKPHPKDVRDNAVFNKFQSLQRLSLDNTKVVDSLNISMNELAAKAKLIVGINSTSLIESLVHYTPVINFGRNVIMPNPHPIDALNTKDYIKSAADNAKGFTDADKHLVDNKLLYLHANQVSIVDPQPWAMSKILNYDEKPRSIEDLR